MLILGLPGESSLEGIPQKAISTLVEISYSIPKSEVPNMVELAVAYLSLKRIDRLDGAQQENRIN